jgi:hypothetical protein
MAGGGVAMKEGALTNDRRTGQFTTGSELTDKQSLFVKAYVLNGGSQTKAAEVAGYADPGVRAYELVRNPAVLRAIRDEMSRVLFAEVGACSVKVMLDVMRDPGAKNSDRVQAVRLGLEASKLIKRDKSPEDNPLNKKPLSEMTIAELDKFIAGGLAAIQPGAGAILVEDSAPNSAPLIEGEVISD